MFTGLIKFIFEFKIIGNKLYLFVNKQFLELVSLGDSIAVNGVCLTLMEILPDACVFELSKETMNISNLATTKISKANVELALRHGDYVGGHYVSGHVHKTGEVVSLENNELVIDLHEPHPAAYYKNSITINGVSLTIASIENENKNKNKSKSKSNNKIRIALITETLLRTNLSLLVPGEKVNVEFCASPNHENEKDHSYFMKLAIQEGELGRSTSPPNPWVGCVIVNRDTNDIISKGYHEKAGMDHAELVAIKNCNDKSILQNAILYCTLEPCVLFSAKRTKSCADFIIEHKIPTVIVGILDPDDRVSGLGVKKLKESGIEVILIEDVDKKVHDAITFSLRQYIHQRKTGLPYVIAKIALTADGCYNDGDGFQKWITHAGSREELYKLWSASQAVIVGANTIQKDDVDLTVEDSNSLVHTSTHPAHLIKPTQQMHFKKVVIDGACLTNTSHKIFRDKDVQVVSSTPEKWKENSNATIISISDTHDMTEVLREINKSNNENIMQCLVEGGGKLHHSFFEAGLINEIIIFRGSKIFGINGQHWNIPKTNIIMHDVKVINYDGENNIMERYLVKPPILLQKQQKQQKQNFDDLDCAIEEFKRGGMVIIVDDESRENEGDLVVAASKITENQMTEIINNTSGIICCPIDATHAARLNLSLLYLPGQNTDKNTTPFTTTVDHIDTKTGISSKDRLMTVRALADKNTVPTDLNRPGHIFPLIANPNGLATRQGHTEASVAICQLANIYPPVAVIGELKNQNGTIKNREDCFIYSKNNNIPIISIEQLSKRMEKLDRPAILAECNLKLKIGKEEWKQYCFDNGSGELNNTHIVIVYPHNFNPQNATYTIPVRIHSECFTGDVLGSELCDCGPQLQMAMKYIVEKGCGVVIFPSGHEGRGIGRVYKCKAYNLKQKTNADTFEANEQLGFARDARTYDDVPKILTKLKINQIELLTENPNKINIFKNTNINVPEVRSLTTDLNNHNKKYLLDKRKEFDIVGTLVPAAPATTREKVMNKAFPEVDDAGRNSRYKIGISYAAWHAPYITRIRIKIKQYIQDLGIKPDNIFEMEVPGTAELSWGVKQLYRSNAIDGAIVIGILLKGDTYHFEAVAGGVYANVGSLRDTLQLPIINGVLAVTNYDQVEDRIDGHKSTLEYLTRSLLKLIITN